jgi:integrase/recombinase XerD
MLTTFFTSPCAVERYRSGMAGQLLDDFVTWLDGRGYRRSTIRRHVRGVCHFASWAQTAGLGVQQLDQDALRRLRSDSAEPIPDHRHIYQSACVFVRFLSVVGVVTPPPPLPCKAEALLLNEFGEWMRAQRGTLDSTLANYRLPITDLLRDLGTIPSAFTAIGLREFLLRRVTRSSQESSKNIATAVRMFLRFLIARGDCAAGLDHAIPTVARWRLSSLPKYLSPDEVECLIDSCDSTLPLGGRDRAILLLIARLGLRAGDVSALKFGSLLWSDGTLIVAGKNRHMTRLPLPQDVGEAVLHYLKYGRPHVATDRVFITSFAPFVAITRQTVGRVVARAIIRTGMEAPAHGAHLLRHSAATRLLREGVSLPSIGALLRHASIETTTVYAKVDVDLLREVAMHWPEARPC